ncbi:MAG TPA: DEAD/DEAH box helicase [Verrucomicrobiae bacterium]
MIQIIERYLNRIPHETSKRGRNYFIRGAVLELEPIEKGTYNAIVRGTENYQVHLDFDEGELFAECSCPIGEDCKHIVAALLTLRQDLGGTAKIEGPGSAQKARGIPQPPRSPLADKLLEKLGRELRWEETTFVQRVQNAFGQARLRNIAESDLAELAQNPSGYDYNKRWSPWPDLPSDDYHFWLYAAWEMRQRRWAYPQFMDPITDFSPIEGTIKKLERQREVDRWKHWFTEFQDRPFISEPEVLDLRMAIFAAEARLQWRTSADMPFAELKQEQARRLGEQFNQGALALTPNSLPLWAALYKPWGYDNWWTYKYSNAAARPALNRLLRMPLTPDRVVTADGQPLARASEPLRLELRPPKNDDDNYELALAASDGSPPPRVLCALHGRPTLYLTERSLFAGPSADLLETDSLKSIPASALETADGLRFLHAAEVPLPEHLAQRIKTAPVTVTISCKLDRPYSGSMVEDITITATAAAPGLKAERFTPQGWEESDRYNFKNSSASEKRGKKSGYGITVYDRAAQRHFPRILGALQNLKYAGYNGGWQLRLTKKTPEIFVAWLKSLPPEIEVVLDSELATLRDEPVSGSVSLDVAEAGIDWFDLKVALNMTDTALTPDELKLLLNARGGYVRLGKKGWRRLQFNLTPEDDEQLARLGLDARDFSAEPQRFHALQLADDAAKKFLAPDRVQKIQRRVDELKTRVAPPVPPSISAQMRPYQVDGFHFLAYLTSNRFGGVLADDMGLGKTLQTLAWLAWLRESATGSQPSAILSSLVVCPKSVMDNWRAEAERFCPGLRVRLWRGEPAEELATARGDADLIVVNYSQLRALSPGITNHQWLAAILDEAQYIKNPDSQTAQASRALKAEHRLALTGTPIENRLLDLWSIFSFAMPGALSHRAHFLRQFNAKDDPLARRRLAARVRPFLLRRAKSQVAKDLPDRVEEDLLCEMEGEQKTLYRAELKRARQILLKLKTHEQLNSERFNILTSLLRLRQICCHPALVDGKLREAESAKVAALEDLLEPLMEEGHKVLVFSQFVTMLDLLRETVTRREWPHFYLAGDTENRGKLVRDFQSATGGTVFLISLKAGGFGLNLTAASYVVLFDPWWNPAVENQAIDRTHRIGQTSKVMAYRLLMRESIEEKIRALQKQKAALAADVLGEERFAQSLTLDDLKFLFAD